jgi:predicted ribosome quality control (RQC) complex YloA/Tae2 family protein
MKTELSSIELHYIIKELQSLISAKVEQIYQVAKDELIIQLHVPSTGKKILRIMLGKLMYLASAKPSVPEKPPGFCLYLRKRLKNARLRELKQIGFDRIIEFSFETKDAKYKMIIELFSKGNIIICNEENKIVSVLERQEWKDRSVKPGEPCKYPKKEVSFLDITSEQLKALLTASDKENLVKSLAIELGIGGVYAEELCLISKVDKNLKPNQLSDKELASIHEGIQELRNKELAPLVILPKKAAEARPEKDVKDVKDIIPFPLTFYKDFPSTSADSFSNALDSILTDKAEEKAIDSAEKTAKTKIDKVEDMIKSQEQRIAGLEKSEKENQRKGEFIYENYPLVEQALKGIAELRKTLSWKEVKEKFRNHKIIKDVDEKTGEITLEL